MTHGCLIIQEWLTGKRRQLLLHTHHTGGSIPKLVQGVPAWRIRQRYTWLLAWDNRDRISYFKTIKDVEEFMNSQSASDGINWPPSVAAWLIAQSSGMLEPTPRAFTKDLPKWSGLDAPYTLRLSDDHWKLYDGEDQKMVEIKPWELMRDTLWEEIQKAQATWAAHFNNQEKQP